MFNYIKHFKTIIYKKISKHALVSNTVVTVTLMTSADILQQNIESDKLIKKISDYDLTRTKYIGIVGVATGPLMHGWYKLLDTKLPGKTFNIMLKKLTLDQLIGSTLFLAVYFIGISLLEGHTVKESCEECIRKFPFTYLVDCFIWPPCQFINFYYLPSQFRVLFVNTILFCYNVFLSYMKHYDAPKQK